MYSKVFGAVLFYIALTFTSSFSQVLDFPNTLDLKKIPTRWEDRTCYCFSDMGAWHGFALPPSTATQYYGGFIGPYEMVWNGWMGESYVQVILTDADAGQEIRLSSLQPDEITFYPGLLKQKFTTQGITLELEMWYVSGRSSVVRAKVTNTSNATKKIKVEWKGKFFTVSQYTYEALSDGVRHFIDDFWFRVQVGDNNFKSATGDQHNYRTATDKVYSIEAGKSISSFVAISLLFKESEFDTEKNFITTQVFSNIDKSYNDNIARWNEYLIRLLKNKQGQFIVDQDLQATAIKCLATLVTNWRSPAGDFLHDGIYPSHSVSYFNGFWAWDTWKHSFALASIIPDLAKNGIRSMFDYQDSKGMIPDCIYITKSGNNYRNSKPALTTWAVWEIFKHTDDQTFLQEMYPKLKKYHEWWYTYRDNDKNGLSEYGATDGTLEAAAWESGMENAVRYDNTQMLNNGNGGWSMNQESVDNNCYLYEEKLFLGLIAEKLNLASDAAKFKTDAEALKQKIQTSFYDNSSGYFYDKKVAASTLVKVQGPEGWTPLFTGVATQAQAEKVKSAMLDANKFNTFAPFPTCAKDATGFSATAYWRGPIWLDQAYFGVKALERYGFTSDATTMKNKLLTTLQNVKNSNKPVRENYNPLTGAGLNAENFSWSAAHLMLLCRNEGPTKIKHTENTLSQKAWDFFCTYNPISGCIQLRLNKPFAHELSLSIYTIGGKLVTEKKIKPYTKEITISADSAVSKGAYYVMLNGPEIQSAKGVIFIH